MKRKLLLICSLLTTTIFSNLHAQDFDVDFLQWFGANSALFGKTNAKDAMNIWKANGAAGTRAVQNNISAYVVNRPNNIGLTNEPDPNPTALRARFDNDLCDIIIESPNADLATIALQYRGNADGAAGAFKISYGTDAASPLTTYTFPSVTSASPGQASFFNFPIDPFEGTTLVRYVKIQRAAGIQSALYRIATSSTVFTSLKVLPLDFLSFTAKANAIGNSVNLNWKTTNEVNTKEFVVERGTDATNFKAIGTLASANTAGEHNYNFEDVSAGAGTVYYRIKQVDKNGEFAYSAVTSVEVKSALSVKIYPNPTTDVLNVTYAAATKASLKVINSQGQPVINQAVASGSVSTSLNTSSLSSGIYYLILNSNGKRTSYKFVKN